MFISGPDAPSLQAFRTIQRNVTAVNNSLTMLATGDRIPAASFDPASLITSENFRTVLAALDAEVRVAQRGEAVINTADAALSEASGLLIEAEALAVANSNTAGLSDAEREANQMQIDSIVSTVERLAGSTVFNSDPLLDGTATVRSGDASVTILDANPTSLGVTDIDGESFSLADVAAGGALDTQSRAGDALTVLRTARREITTNQAELGAFSRNTLGGQIETLGVTFEAISAANSLIRDTEFASETSSLTRNLLLFDSTVATLSMIQSSQSRVLDLLG